MPELTPDATEGIVQDMETFRYTTQTGAPRAAAGQPRLVSCWQHPDGRFWPNEVDMPEFMPTLAEMCKSLREWHGLRIITKSQAPQHVGWKVATNPMWMAVADHRPECSHRLRWWDKWHVNVTDGLAIEAEEHDLLAVFPPPPRLS